MTEVWCSGPVPTKAIVHRGGWQIPLKPCQFLCQHSHTHKHTHIHISDYQAKPDKWGAYRTAGKAWHSSTHGPLTTHPHPLCLAHSGGSVHTHTHTHARTHTQPAGKKTASVLCFRVILLFQPIVALVVKTGAERCVSGRAFTLTKTSRPDQSVWGLTHTHTHTHTTHTHKTTRSTLQSCRITY